MNAHKVCMCMKMRYILVEQFSYTLFCYPVGVSAETSGPLFDAYRGDVEVLNPVFEKAFLSNVPKLRRNDETTSNKTLLVVFFTCSPTFLLEL